MAGGSASMALLAAIANEQRAALMQVQGTMPLMQGAQTLGRGGTMSLLSRQLFMGGPAAMNQQVFMPRIPMKTQLVVPKAAAPPKPVAGKLLVPSNSSPSLAIKATTQERSSSSPNLLNETTAKTSKPAPVPGPTPKKYLKELFDELDIGESKLPKRFMNGDFVKPGDDENQSYNDAARFVRNNELDKIKALHADGKNLDACNRLGESLLHLACRRGHVAIAEFLLSEAKVRWDVQDDFGRTILHDACWRPSPSLELMEVILKVVSPEWLMAQDVRGHTPFDYARKDHSATWYGFLKKKEELLKRRLSLLT